MEEYKAQYFTAILTLSKQKQIVEHELHPQKLIILKYCSRRCNEICARTQDGEREQEEEKREAQYRRPFLPAGHRSNNTFCSFDDEIDCLNDCRRSKQSTAIKAKDKYCIKNTTRQPNTAHIQPQKSNFLPCNTTK